MMIDERYRHFLAAARTLHFTRAGEEVFRTQSTISQSVAAIEAELSVELFLREGKRMRLTPAGERLRRACEEAEAIARTCSADIRDLAGLVTGELRIGTSSTNACYWLPPFVAAFRRTYPGIQLKILNGSSLQLSQAVLDDVCDVAFVTLPVPGKGLDVRDLGPREDVVICSPGSRLLRHRPPTLRDLTGVSFIMPHPQAQSRDFIETIFAREGIAVTVSLEIRGIEIIKRYVEADFGLAIVPRLSVGRECAAGMLEAWSVFGPEQQRRIAMIQKRRSNPHRLVDAFQELVVT